MALIDTFLARLIQRGELTVTLPGGTTRTFGTPDATLAPVHIRFADRRAIVQMVRDPSLGTAETFMDGRLVLERGDIRDLLTLATANSRWEDGSHKLDASPMRKLWTALRFRIDRVNMQRRAKRNVAHHYDLSARLYDLFLDSDRQYSCAYFTDPEESLEQAQADKKAHIVAKLAIRPNMRVLDIGCGWGGMALYIHRKTGAEVLGITLSEEQLKIARERAEAEGVADKVRFELIDYRDVTGTFDRIVSVGMFEHVGTPQFTTYFRKVHDLLGPDGVALIHTIGREGLPGVTDEFTAKYIFPGGYIPAMSEVMKASEQVRLFLTDVEVLRLHYAITLEHWYRRTTAARAQIVALYDERFYRMWTYYLAGAEVSFRHSALVNFQLQFSRSRTALPITRDYMLAEEQRLHETVDQPDAIAAE